MKAKIESVTDSDGKYCQLCWKVSLAYCKLTWRPKRARKDRVTLLCVRHTEGLHRFIEWCNARGLEPNLMHWYKSNRRDSVLKGVA